MEFARRMDSFHHLDCGEHVVNTVAWFVTRFGIGSRNLVAEFNARDEQRQQQLRMH